MYFYPNEMASAVRLYQETLKAFPVRFTVEKNGDFLRRIEKWRYDNQRAFQYSDTPGFAEEIQRLLREIPEYAKD